MFEEWLNDIVVMIEAGYPENKMKFSNCRA